MMTSEQRASYMATLKLSISNNDRTLQAVKLNQRTGQVPIPPSDNRTLDEKMSDLEQLKSQVRADLLTITDGANASAILSTLNTDDLKFLAQKFELMAKEIRPKYKLGITQPQFSDFLESYMKYEAKNPIAGRDTGRADMGVALQRINGS